MNTPERTIDGVQFYMNISTIEIRLDYFYFRSLAHRDTPVPHKTVTIKPIESRNHRSNSVSPSVASTDLWFTAWFYGYFL